MKIIIRFVALALILVSPAARAACTSTITPFNFLDAGSVSRSSAWGVDASSRYFGMNGVYGLNGNYQADVNSDCGLDAHVTNFPATQPISAASLPLPSGAALEAGNLAALVANQNGPYPPGATPITASGTGSTGATTATLTNVSGNTTYICGFSIRANATAAATGNATVTGTKSGTLNFTQWTAPAASGLGVTEEIFLPCVPASAISTNIAVVSAAPGTGGVVSVTVWGYSL